MAERFSRQQQYPGFPGTTMGLRVRNGDRYTSVSAALLQSLCTTAGMAALAQQFGPVWPYNVALPQLGQRLGRMDDQAGGEFDFLTIRLPPAFTNWWGLPMPTGVRRVL